MDDIERISVGVAYIGGIVSRIVFQSCAGRNVVTGTSGHCGLVEFIDLIFVFGREAPVNGCWIRLPLLYPEECLLAVTKSPQIGLTVFALVRHEEFDIKRLQGRLIERQPPFDIADSENNVVEHRLPSKHECFNGLFAVGYSMDLKRWYVHALSPDGRDLFNSNIWRRRAASTTPSGVRKFKHPCASLSPTRPTMTRPAGFSESVTLQRSVSSCLCQ